MLVRLKKRGEFPKHNRWGLYEGNGNLQPFRGMCIEVLPFWYSCHTCGGVTYEVIDGRLWDGITDSSVICEHYFIDDPNAYDSDSEDSQAEVGDLAMAGVRQSRAVKL